MTTFIRLLLSAVVCLTLLASCARLPGPGVTPLRFDSTGGLRDYLLSHKADVDLFRYRGPFPTTVRKGLVLEAESVGPVSADLYLAAPTEKAPLVILLHGHDNLKTDHAYQALHLATWGLHALIVQLPNQGPWVDNGKAFVEVAEFVRDQPDILDPRIDPKRIILAGHSYGAAATAIALAEGAPAVGGVLLDPAVFGREVSPFLRRVAKPVTLITSDPQASRVQGRGLFYTLIRANVAQISVRNAYHEDAEFPLESRSKSIATEEHQITFASALTSAAFSLGYTGRLDYVWASFDKARRDGKLFDALRK